MLWLVPKVKFNQSWEITSRSGWPHSLHHCPISSLWSLLQPQESLLQSTSISAPRCHRVSLIIKLKPCNLICRWNRKNSKISQSCLSECEINWNEYLLTWSSMPHLLSARCAKMKTKRRSAYRFYKTCYPTKRCQKFLTLTSRHQNQRKKSKEAWEVFHQICTSCRKTSKNRDWLTRNTTSTRSTRTSEYYSKGMSMHLKRRHLQSLH